MILVARYDAKGPFAGRTRMLREVSGDQKWTVKIAVLFGMELKNHTLRAKQPVQLIAMFDLAQESIKELAPEGATADDARMLFYIQGRRG